MNTIPAEYNFLYQERYIREIAFVVEEEKNPSASNDLFDYFRLIIIAQFLNRKIKKINKDISIHLTDFDSYLKNLKKEQLLLDYDSIKKILNSSEKLFDKNNMQNIEWYFRPLIKSAIKLISYIKDLEMKYRIAAYPEINEVPLTYDELKELSEALSSWKCVDEENTKISS